MVGEGGAGPTQGGDVSDPDGVGVSTPLSAVHVIQIVAVVAYDHFGIENALEEEERDDPRVE